MPIADIQRTRERYAQYTAAGARWTVMGNTVLA